MLTELQKQTQKEYNKYYYEKNKQKMLTQQKQYRVSNPDRKKLTDLTYNKKRTNCALQSLYCGHILDLKLWSSWFNDKDKTVSYDISPDEAFILMNRCCYYCGSFATTLDRLDSTLTHNVENCVGCCIQCNQSKGALDPLTFILRAVYRRTFVYYEDEDIWHDNKNKPRYDKYKVSAERQNRKFELTREQFNKLVVGQCHYCKRQPSTGIFFGIDKVFPDDGYTINNCVSACASCNRAKWDNIPNEFTLRDERITQRYLEGYFNNMPQVYKHISNHKHQ